MAHGRLPAHGEPLDQDVYDAAAWSAIGPLEREIHRQPQPVDRRAGLHPRPLENHAAVGHRVLAASSPAAGGRGYSEEDVNLWTGR